MARKHSKKFSVKQPVKKVVLSPAVQSKERVAVEVPEATTGAIPVTQEDGSVKFFVIQFKIVVPERAKFVATGPTTKGRGKNNTPANMAPKGRSGQQGTPGKGGK